MASNTCRRVAGAEAGSHPRGIVKILALVESDHDRIDSEIARDISADNELLRSIDPRLLPAVPLPSPG